jgi:hypothetical protein
MSSLSTAERRIISDSMIGETWQAKVSEILEIVAGEGREMSSRRGAEGTEENRDCAMNC